MEKQKKMLIVLAVIVGVCLILWAVLSMVNKNKEEAEQEDKEAQTNYVLNLGEGSVTSFTYNYEGTDYTFNYDSDEWTSEQMDGEDLNEETLQNMADAFAVIEANEVIEDPEDTSDYGLEEPTAQLSITTSDGEEITIYINAYNDMTGEYFMTTSLSDDVYVVGTTVYDYITSDPSTLIVEADDETEGETSE